MSGNPERFTTVQRSLLLDLLLNAVGLGLASWAFDGLVIASGGSFIALVLIIGILNLILKPLLVLFTLPFVFLTLGLGLWVINALILLLAGNIIDGVHVDGFLTALLASAVVSLLGFFLSSMIYPGRVRLNIHRTGGKNRSTRHKGGGDVIDV